MASLAEILRPESLDSFVGQSKLVGQNGLILKMIETKNISSMILWGPPASGKTTLARIIAKASDSEFYTLSAVMDGKEELKKILTLSKQNQANGKNTILFIDEIHRWNKAQQDSLLKDTESGQLILIGATTENPSFSINSALLSRCRVFVLESHSIEDIVKVLNTGLKYLLEKSNYKKSKTEPEVLVYLANMADGDLRFALNTLEMAFELGKGNITPEIIQSASQKSLQYDKNGEEHYNLISALHKSLRSSDATAGVYWLMRMLAGGEDPKYVARRMLRFASEDVGNTNPNALLLANQVFSAVERLGMPECETALVQLAEYLAKSPKNNSAYLAVGLAKQDIQKHGSLPVPLHFRNAPTKLMKNLGYGKGYVYDHDLPNKKSDQETLPPELKGRRYFD